MNMDRAFNEHELNQALEHLRATMYLINRLTLSKHQFELSEMTKNELRNDIQPVLRELYKVLRDTKSGVDYLERQFKQSEGNSNAK